MTLTLVEHTPTLFTIDALTLAGGEALWRAYGRSGGPLVVEFPTPATDGHWRLTNRGYVGLLPLPDGTVLQLLPKIPLDDLFALLEYAFDWRHFHLLDDLVSCRTLLAFYDRLAALLARLTLRRLRQGLYRRHVTHTATLPAIRGRLVRRPTAVLPAPLTSRFTLPTTAIDDNHLVAWTLRLIARNALCTPATQSLIRRAAHALPTPPRPYTVADCLGRPYSRLNADYRLLHALCRFFLADGGPAVERGPVHHPPFLVDMSAVFERFVAAWLAANTPAGWHLYAQEQVDAGHAAAPLRYRIDLLLEDADGRRLVLDTKYKSHPRPQPADINQVVAYAQLTGAADALLIYPDPAAAGHTFTFDNLRVHTRAFPLTGDLDAHGRHLLAHLPPPSFHLRPNHVKLRP